MKDWALLAALVAAIAGAAGLPVEAQETEGASVASRMTIASGPFRPDWDSLKQYKVPEWFRDAKFGIWAHWSAQCVPEQGDWYARRMYMQGDSDYQYHVEHYGHPSRFGFKDICNLWKAEKWDPERLIRLYKRVGAKYFVALANHHCNFDCYDSKYQPWNSVNIGPKKDIVGIWAKAARKYGLRFGVTVHDARSWDWYDVAHGSDRTGPLAGVPYDGALTKADGKGLWWEGYDPADLYGPHGAARTPLAREAYILKWFLRTRDLVDKYNPDLLYFDDGDLPLGVAGKCIAAHYYNANMQRHGGRLEAVLNIKGPPPGCRQAVVLDIERGRSDRMEELPWQTDTCIGEWHYHRGIRYASVQEVVHQLVDIVSKNGNLLLNIPVRGDGTIDEDEVKFCEGMAAWMDVNSECIYGTRPWGIFGEGPRRGRRQGFGTQDIRFTTKGGALYAVAMGWPADGRIVIRSLARPAGMAVNRLRSIKLLGYRGSLKWSQTAEGLVVMMPARKPCEHAFVLKIAGTGLKPMAYTEPSAIIQPAADGSLTLDAESAEVHGSGARVEEYDGKPNIGFWDSAGDWISWQARFAQPGDYEITINTATPHAGSEVVVEVAGQQVAAVVPATQGFGDFHVFRAGRIQVRQAGQQTIKVRPRDAATWKAINLRFVTLKKVG
jgi:alpha-L-fucosidase